MTPCSQVGAPDFDTLATTDRELIDAGMRAVVYCGSMGDWPLLTDEQRPAGVDALLSADVAVVVGVDTQVVHGFVRCGATGAITGVGNALPEPVLRLVSLCEDAATGNFESLRLAKELDAALSVLAKFDEGPDLVLYYKRLMVLAGNSAYERQLNSFDSLSDAQRRFIDTEWRRFRQWWECWPGATAAKTMTN